MNNKNSVIIYNIPIEKVQDGDTEIGYKMLAELLSLFLVRTVITINKENIHLQRLRGCL